MSAAVDVLALLDHHAIGMRAASASGGIKLSKVACGNFAKEMTDVRAAVAALVEATNAALNQDQVELPGWLTEQLSAALARTGGAA